MRAGNAIAGEFGPEKRSRTSNKHFWLCTVGLAVGIGALGYAVRRQTAHAPPRAGHRSQGSGFDGRRFRAEPR